VAYGDPGRGAPPPPRLAPALGARGVCTVARVVVVARAASMSSAMQSAASCYYEAKDIFAAPSPRVV
jgi:glycosyltransferase A (GT-A) superfamily protein (DUF2064 family)